MRRKLKEAGIIVKYQPMTYKQPFGNGFFQMISAFTQFLQVLNQRFGVQLLQILKRILFLLTLRFHHFLCVEDKVWFDLGQKGEVNRTLIIGRFWKSVAQTLKGNLIFHTPFISVYKLFPEVHIFLSGKTAMPILYNYFTHLSIYFL